MKNKEAQSYFWQDKSGRGMTNTFTKSELSSAFKGERNYDGQAMSGWLKYDPAVGAVWENESDRVTRTK